MSVIVCAVMMLLAVAGSSATAPSTVTISYRDLLDDKQLIRTGQPLGQILTGAPLPGELRGAVQPFLDIYSRLLPETINMVKGPSDATSEMRNITEYFAPGSAQPAWVALFRGGRILVEWNQLDHARVFLLGPDDREPDHPAVHDSPRAAYAKNYPVIRHCLTGLLRDNGSIIVEVYAYRQNYGRAELSLNLTPYIFRASAFPPPQGKASLDIARLNAFFQGGGILSGATLDQNGLELVSSGAGRMAVGGSYATLADLAVAYRAIFHAGDNAAFISLDPNSDPTRATVNFGGYLENTAIGSTVLEADKRFKFIGAGLDPNTFDDARAFARLRVPEFMTSAERDLISGTTFGGRWIGTRFWFYPESVEIETDPEFREAVITRAHFTADAERQRDDFADPAAFARLKKRTLSPAIRDCIADLNADYDNYALAFPELAELSTVARLFGVCAWLKKGHGDEIDLDALLAVELPAFTTPRSKPQMIAANWIIHPANTAVTSDLVRDHMVTKYLTPFLNQPIQSFFTLQNLEALPSVGRGAGAQAILASRGTKAVREVISTKEDLQVFAKLAAEKFPLESLISTWSGDRSQFNGISIQSMSVISIGGGIDLRPDDFRITVRGSRRSGRSAASPRPSPRPSPSPSSSSSPSPIRTASGPHAQPGPQSPSRPATAPAQPIWKAPSVPNRPAVAVAAGTVIPAAPTNRIAAPVNREQEPSSWTRKVTTLDGRAVDRVYDAPTRTLVITETSDGQSRRIAARQTGDRIVFRKLP